MSQMPNEAEQYLLASTFTKRLAMHLNGVQPAELMGDLDGQRAILKDFGGHILFLRHHRLKGCCSRIILSLIFLKYP